MVVIRLWSWLVLGGQTPWFMLETLPPRAGERQYKGGRKTGVGVRNRESAVWCACRTDRPRPTHIYMHTALRTYVGCTHLLVRMGLLFVVLSDLQQRSLMFIRGSLRVPTPSWCKRFPTNDHNSCSHNVLVGIYVLGVITEWLYTRKRQQQYSQSTSMLSSTTNTPQTRTVYSSSSSTYIYVRTIMTPPSALYCYLVELKNVIYDVGTDWGAHRIVAGAALTIT